MPDFKDITVHVNTDESCAARLDVAMDLARRFEAHLTGLCIDPGLRLPVTSEIPLPAEVAEQAEQLRKERIDKMRTTFDEATHAAEFPVEWRYIDRELVTALNLNARYCDLLLLGQDQPGRGDYVVGGLPDQVVMSAGVPVLVVPYIGVQQAIGRRILLAWNGSREAIRAAHDALPLLNGADTVVVLSIDPDEDAVNPTHLPGADLATHLARHGVKVQAETYRMGAGMNVADALLSHVADIDADLVVMGAYGHWRWRELLLGGATRKILETMTVPTLLSH
ncbi:MAG: universal stress protein [Gammaproteobacteria bacterium]